MKETASEGDRDERAREPEQRCRAQTAGLIAALAYIDNVSFHGIATNLGGPSPKIDANWAGLIRNARTAVGAVRWPEDVKALAERFAAAAAQLVTAIEQRDTIAAANPAKEIHVAYHALSDAGWNHLAAGTLSKIARTTITAVPAMPTKEHP